MTKREIRLGDWVVIAAKDHEHFGVKAIVMRVDPDGIIVMPSQKDMLQKDMLLKIEKDKLINPSPAILHEAWESS